MDTQTDDWMTDTAVIRFQAADLEASQKFAEHFVNVLAKPFKREGELA